MAAWAGSEVHRKHDAAWTAQPEVAIVEAQVALPAGTLRHVRRGLAQWLDGVIEAPAMGRPDPLPTDVAGGLAEALQAASGHGSSLQSGLADALQRAQALQRMSAGATPTQTLVREGLGLLMHVSDLESDWSAQQAWLDPLTGLPGRRALQQRLQSELSRLRRQGDNCSLALLDLDHFKPVNDEFGHLVGDRYLAAFASALNARLRSYDAAFRYGGDEFVLCLPQASEHQARSVVDRLRVGLAEKPLMQTHGRDLYAAFSAGVAALDADKSLGQTLGEADARLYAAKRDGSRRSLRSV